jgi:NADH-quinone oxidoreductase subunit I
MFGGQDVVTIQYPEEQRHVYSRRRGRYRLTRREDGFIKCVACYMCETIYPAHCIYIESGNHPYLSIKKSTVIFDIYELRCVFCGLCVEDCPNEAIRIDNLLIAMAYSFQSSFDYTLDLLKYTYRPNKQTKYIDIPLPKTEEESLTPTLVLFYLLETIELHASLLSHLYW